MYVVSSSRNAVANARNRFQGMDKKVLCVCSAGVLRSPTLANLLHEQYGYNTRSAGIESSYALIPVSEALLEWADEICVVEKWMADALKNEIEGLYGDSGAITIYNLNVKDEYEYDDEELKQLLLAAYKRCQGWN